MGFLTFVFIVAFAIFIIYCFWFIAIISTIFVLTCFELTDKEVPFYLKFWSKLIGIKVKE